MKDHLVDMSPVNIAFGFRSIRFLLLGHQTTSHGGIYQWDMFDKAHDCWYELDSQWYDKWGGCEWEMVVDRLISLNAGDSCYELGFEDFIMYQGVSNLIYKYKMYDKHIFNLSILQLLRFR